MQRRRTLVIAAVIAVMLVVLLVVVSCGFAALYTRLGQTFSVSQTRPATATQQINPGLAALSGTPQMTLQDDSGRYVLRYMPAA